MRQFLCCQPPLLSFDRDTCFKSINCPPNQGHYGHIITKITILFCVPFFGVEGLQGHFISTVFRDHFDFFWFGTTVRDEDQRTVILVWLEGQKGKCRKMKRDLLVIMRNVPRETRRWGSRKTPRLVSQHVSQPCLTSFIQPNKIITA